jgi:hypothetical protein
VFCKNHKFKLFVWGNRLLAPDLNPWKWV